MAKKEQKDVTVSFTANETKILLDFLDQLNDYFGSAGCNDYTLPDSPENRLLIETAAAISHGTTLERWRKDEDYIAPEPHHRKLFTFDLELLHYLEDKIKKAQKLAKKDK